MKQTLGIVLIIVAIALGYMGYDKMQNSKAALKIGDLEISASDKSSNESAYLLLGLGAVSLLGGLVMITRSKS
jgi:general stress protein CsbA